MVNYKMNALHCAGVSVNQLNRAGRKGSKKKTVHMNVVVPNSVQLVEIDSWQLTNSCAQVLGNIIMLWFLLR